MLFLESGQFAAPVFFLVLVQGFTAGGVVNSAGLTLGAVMGQYWIAPVCAAVLAAVAAFLAFKNVEAEGSILMMVVVAVCALAAIALARVCFYGIFISMGLF